jgi:hypothetical protein
MSNALVIPLEQMNSKCNLQYFHLCNGYYVGETKNFDRGRNYKKKPFFGVHLIKNIGVVLAKPVTVHSSGCYCSSSSSSFFFTFFNNNQHQNILTFFTFYITLIIFYYYSNKKIHYNTKLFHFFIQILFSLYHIITFY